MEQKLRPPLFNPATGETIGYTLEDTVQDLHEAIAEAREAQAAWRNLTVRQRVPFIDAMRRYLVRNADRIAETISRSTGKTRIDAMSTEVMPSAMAAAYYARIATRVHKVRRIRGGNILLFNKVSTIMREPYGVIGIISPWNYPFSIPFHEVVMALLAGNAVILRVATQAQLVGKEIDRVVRSSKLPHGLFRLVHLPRETAGTALLEQGVNKIFFTGSTPVGRELMEKAAPFLTPLVLELGGNDAMIVLDDADPERAAAGAAWAGFSNCGQSCAGVERIYVVESIYAEFRWALMKEVESLRVGPDRVFDVDMGPLTLQAQKDRVKLLVSDALDKGAVITGRSRPPATDSPLYHPALVLENVDESMRLMNEEVFGPVLALQRVRDEEDAVRKANASPYGLTASIWSGNPRRARRLAERLEAGTVTINDHLMSHGMAETPWGGFKGSGIGRTHGELGFLEMSQPRVIVDDRLHRLPRGMWWYPHDRAVYQGLKGALDMLYGEGILRRTRAFFRVASLFLRSVRRR